MADLTIGGETFKVEVAGDPMRPVVMLSHALGTDLTMWNGQIDALASHFRVIRYDTRGHGGSDGGIAPTSIAQLGRDALAILDALEIETTHWVGLSMGGSIGLWLLAHAPDRIDRAVLANTAPRIGTPQGWNARITTVLADGMDAIAPATMARWFSADFTVHAPQRVNAIDALFRKTAPKAYAACCAALRDMDLSEAIQAIEHEVLVVTGRDDPTVPPADVTAFLAAIPGAEHVALWAKHIANVEAEVAFNAAILGFLTAKATPARTARRKTGPTTTARTKTGAAKTGPAKTGPTKTGTAKTAVIKTTAAKRGRATPRSNAARSPLKKAATKRIAAKKTARRSTAAAKKALAGRRRPTAKATVARRTTSKVAAKRPSKTPRKTATTRRATPRTTARVGAKAVVKKAKIKAMKATTKKSAGKVTKRLPATRRKPASKPRRPKGRRTP